MSGNNLADAIARLNAEMLQPGADATGPGDVIEDYRKELQRLEDQLDPVGKATSQYQKDVERLNDAMERGERSPERTAELLAELERQYKDNTKATSEWAKWTEGALDRVDSAFADAWRNIGDGFSSFRDSLTNAFKQMLAELAHMAITKPIIMQIGASLGIGNGTHGNNGIWGSLLGGSGGSGGGGTDVLGTVNQARSLYSAYGTASSLWPALSGGWANGGFGGALSAGVSGIGSMFGIGSGAAGSLAAGSTAAGYTGSAYASWAAAQAAGGAGAAGAGGIGGAFSGALSSAASMWYLAPLIGMWQSGKLFDQGIRADSGALKDQSKEWSGAGKAVSGIMQAQTKLNEFADNLIGSVVGDKLAAMITGSPITQLISSKLGSKLFGGAWEQKAAGIALSGTGGDFLGQQYIFSKKDGGLFGSDKKKTEYSEMDATLARTLGKRFDEVTESALTIFDSFGFDVGDNALDGLNVKKAHIRTDSKKKQEQLQENIDKWFGTVGNASTDLIGGGLVAGFASRITDATSETLGAALEAAGAQLTDKQMKGLSGLSGAKLTKKLSSMVGTELAAQISGSVDEARAAVFEQLTTLDADMASSLSGLSGKKLTAELEKLTGFGKNAYESLAELAGKLEAVNATFELLNLSAYESSLGGAKLAEDLVAIAGGLESLATSTQTYYDAFFSAEEKLEDTINGIKGAFEDADLELAGSRDAYREMVEDIDLTTEAGREMFATMMQLSGQAAQYYSIVEQQAAAAAAQALANTQLYYDQFTTAGQKTEDVLTGIVAQFEELELTLPGARDGFIAAVDALDTTTEAGKKMFDTLMSVAGAADAYYDILEQRASQAVGNAYSLLERSVNAEKTALAAAYQQQKAEQDILLQQRREVQQQYHQGVANSYRDMAQTASATASALSGLSSAISSALGELVDDSIAAVEQRRTAAVAELRRALVTGDLSSADRLAEAAKSAASLDSGVFSSLEDFRREQGRTANLLAELGDLTTSRQTAAEQQAESLQKLADQSASNAQSFSQSIGSVKTSIDYAYEAELAALDEQLALGKSQIDALNGIDNSVVSVADAVSGLAAAITAAMQQIPGLSSITVPGFAAGGSFGGGLRLVGERGPELEVTGPSRIYNASQTASMLGGGAETAGEVRALRQETGELRAYLYQIAKNTGQTASGIRRQNEIGIPEAV